MDIVCMRLSVADTFVYTFSWHLVLSVLWCCWLGGIRPVKNWVVGCWRWCHCHTLSLASVKSRLVLPFWYRLTRVVPDKGPLNGCVSWHFISPLLFPHQQKHFRSSLPMDTGIETDDCFVMHSRSLSIIYMTFCSWQLYVTIWLSICRFLFQKYKSVYFLITLTHAVPAPGCYCW